MMRRRLSCFIVIIVFVINGLFSVTLDQGGFSLYFNKPTKDKFGFCSPDDSTIPFDSGLVFELPNGGEGLPTSVSVGFNFELQSSCTLYVWFNSARMRTDKDFRMRRIADDGTTDTVGLNYLIGIGDTRANADAAISAIPADFNSGAGLSKKTAADGSVVVNENDATVPIIKIDYDNVKKTRTIQYGSAVPSVLVSASAPTDASGADSGKGFIVTSLKLVVPRNEEGQFRGSYAPGQYQGYVTLLYVPAEKTTV